MFMSNIKFTATLREPPFAKSRLIMTKYLHCEWPLVSNFKKSPTEFFNYLFTGFSHGLVVMSEPDSS